MVKKYNFIAHFLLLICLASCSQDREKFDDLSGAEPLYRLGENMKNSGDYNSAIKLYHQALAIDPEYQAANLSLVEILRINGKFEECRNILDKLLLKNPDDEQVLNALGKVSIAQNDGPGCLKSYKSLNKSHPRNPSFLNGLAICHDISHQHKQAQILYRQAIELSPDNLNIQSNYGLSLALSGHTKDAISLLYKLSQRSRSTLNIKHNLAVAYGMAGQTDQARKLFETDLDPQALTQNMKVLNALNKPKPTMHSKDETLFHPELETILTNDALLPMPKSTDKIIIEPLSTHKSSKNTPKPLKKKKTQTQSFKTKTNQPRK